MPARGDNFKLNQCIPDTHTNTHTHETSCLCRMFPAQDKKKGNHAHYRVYPNQKHHKSLKEKQIDTSVGHHRRRGITPPAFMGCMPNGGPASGPFTSVRVFRRLLSYSGPRLSGRTSTSSSSRIRLVPDGSGPPLIPVEYAGAEYGVSEAAPLAGVPRVSLTML